jgi:hypothetical protein
MTQMRRAATLPVAFFRRPTEVVAQDLLGMVVVSTAGDELTTARIVETEAYLGYDDPASHGYLHRRNARNHALFGPPGSWYVFGVAWPEATPRLLESHPDRPRARWRLASGAAAGRGDALLPPPVRERPRLGSVPAARSGPYR